jgi:aspartate/methionine/tyrosine aminotransferase
MFGKTRYIAWALEQYSAAKYDLASSGTPLVKEAELDPLAFRDGERISLDDAHAYEGFREAIAVHNDVTTAEVMPAIGTTHALFLAYAALLSPGDEILVEAPGYEPLTRVAEGLGATVRTFPRFESDGFRVRPEHVAAAVTPRTRAIVVTTLHNPTGIRVDDATLREVAAVAAARGAYLIVDEVYAPFDDLPVDGIFRRSARKLAPNVVAVSSLTKTLGLGMYRIGWLLGPPEVVEQAYHAFIGTVVHLPLAHACFGIAALGQAGRLAVRARTLLGQKREIAERWVKTLPNARWSAPSEGLFGLLTLPGRGDLLPKIEACAKTTGVLAAAGTFFGLPESMRLSWARCDESAFTEALDRLTTITG